METIITQITANVVEEIIKNIEEQGISDIGKTAESLLPALKDGALKILSAVIEETDSAVLNAKKERKHDGITVKQRNVPRTVVTSLGELKYKRTYFQLGNGSKAYLTDQLIGVEPFERVTKELCAALVQNTATMSMQKAATVTGAPVSRQTVNNKVLSMHDVVTEVRRVENTPSELHIFADEDHVHLRPRRSAIVPLVTVTEGIDISNPKRHKTISPVHFQGYGMDNHVFVDNVVAAIYEKYDMDKVKKVYIHADGGNWIKTLGTLMPNAVFVMDGFHLEKYLKKLSRLNGAAPYSGVVRKAIKENNFEAFAGYISSIDDKQDEKGKKKLYELVNYFQNNWDSIVERMNCTHCGSCTEPLISHTLSERLSRNPLAWSKEGLGKMAMLRVFEENGGRVTADHIRVSRDKSDRNKDFNALKNGLVIYNKYAEEQVRSVFGGRHDWSSFEKNSAPAAFTYGKLTGTTILLKACAKLKAV
jgi:hypothetical protein